MLNNFYLFQYGLLGPSGCGKTVLLNCVLGMISLDSGEINLSVSCRKQVGYMPQEISLFEEFTIEEIFIFYGRLFGMDIAAVKRRAQDYKDILGLPDWSQAIANLSGGEQRRISFAVTLIHDPVFLLLDEPTVGVDPILSQRIWTYLLDLSANGKTIILTTHYIEEARQAHKVGLMRHGSILCEDTPDNIMTVSHSSTLEEAFLDLCKKQDTSLPSTPTKSLHLIQQNSGASLPFQNEDVFNINRFLAQLLKNLLWIRRNTLVMFFLMILPAMQSFLYCISVGRDPINLNLVLYSEEFPLYSGHEICHNKVTWNHVNAYNCTIKVPLSCQLLLHLEKSFHVSLEYDMESARQKVLHNQAWAVIYVQSNFSQCMLLRIHDLTIDDKDIIDGSITYITLDATDYVIVNFLKKQIIDRYNEFKTELMNKCNVDTRLGNIPMKFETPIFGSDNPIYSHNGFAGYFCGFCFYFTMMFTSGAIMMEKILGLQCRNMAAGMTYYEIVAAHLTVQFLVITLQKLIMMVIFYVVYDMPLIGSITVLIALLYCIEAIGVAFGFLLTEIFSTEQLVSYAVIGATLGVFSLGGAIWPIQGAHFTLRSLLWAVPVIPAIESFTVITAKGFTISHPVVYYGIISSILWTVLLSVIALRIGSTKQLR